MVRRNKEPSCAVTSLEVPIKCVVFGPATAAQEAERVAPDGPVVSPPHPGTGGVSVFLGDPSTNVEWMLSSRGRVWLQMLLATTGVMVTLTVFWSDTCSAFIVLHCNYSTDFYFPPNLVCSIHSTSSAQMLLRFDPPQWRGATPDKQVCQCL